MPERNETQGKQQGQTMEVQRKGDETRVGRLSEGFPSLFELNPIDFLTMSPFALMRRFSEEFDRTLGFGRPGVARGEGIAWTPSIDIYEREGKLVVAADLPGCRKEDVHVEVTSDGLIIQGERKREHEERGEGFQRYERAYGRFYRRMPLPEGAKPEEIKANFKDGVLEVTIPVPKLEQRRREIPIEAGEKK
ncbi:MAG: Hsp20/alpha crystallin family protein [Bryobacteraceae bacterium]